MSKKETSSKDLIKKVLTVLTLVLVILVVWKAKDQIAQAISDLSKMNIFVLLLLIPEQLFMYYCAGQMFFSYMAAKGRAKIKRSSKKSQTTPLVAENSPVEGQKTKNTKQLTPWALARISFELNFVNHAIPSGGFAGLGYITWRLKPYGSSVGQTSFMYALRYTITILSNQFQTLVAIAILIVCSAVPNDAWWVIGLVGLICVGVIAGLGIIIVIASSQKRINWFAKTATGLVNKVVQFITFDRKKDALDRKYIQDYLNDIYDDLIVARRNKKILIHPIIWGIVYSFFEIATYWIVGISMGHPEILPQVMIAEAIASVIGAVMLTPGGVGGYEGAMIAIMMALGVEFELASIVVVTTRVVVLVGTILSGYGFYQNAVSGIGKEEREAIMREVEK